MIVDLALIKDELESMELIAYTMATPEKIILTVVDPESVNGQLLVLPKAIKACLLGNVSDGCFAASMTAITVPDTTVKGWAVEIVLVPDGASIQPIKDGE